MGDPHESRSRKHVSSARRTSALLPLLAGPDRDTPRRDLAVSSWSRAFRPNGSHRFRNRSPGVRVLCLGRPGPWPLASFRRALWRRDVRARHRGVCGAHRRHSRFCPRGARGGWAEHGWSVPRGLGARLRSGDSRDGAGFAGISREALRAVRAASAAADLNLARRLSREELREREALDARSGASRVVRFGSSRHASSFRAVAARAR